jgi:hypothetical protein
MVHSFKQVDNANGNTTIEFYEDAKKRQIIFQKGTKALYDYQWVGMDDLEKAINYMRKSYKFIANANNKSIFRPISK